ncbi:hypothetical protein [Evansella cellulosilytica]|uniref:Small peptidoglycan-associated lipoprotein n=1 Tax=Evansella cellulosilytica (strain ATCC 21833 / DSM 2522 / FERM P-1141 / JCM 9156 / N-4) TaxID=649639 RepID=E6TUM9_EVAC2|nr:hypothetical protein [Evansella cellulosilytica]ADU30919.1 small peptidoglycan-associated lipoprotein [Evansella cellulosilytica DSM 2522]
MALKFCLLIFSSLLLSSCFSQEADSTSNPFQLYETQENMPITFLFSDDNRLDEEVSYYDALLDFKREHPNRIHQIQIVSIHDESLVEHFHIETHPTLIIIQDDDIKVRIEGYKEAIEILTELETRLIQEQET